MLRLISRPIGAAYAREFAQMFGGRFGKGKTSVAARSRVRVGASRVTALFSPADGVANDVLDAVRAAKSSIHFMAFSYTAKPIAEAMLARSEAGVSVRGVVEMQNATGSGAAFGSLRASGIDVLLDSNCYILHHKSIVIDERIVITGSYNFTNSAENDNDENLVIVDDPALARAYLDELERVYAQAREPARCR
jgi:phosphatidylserine/phosphatidylglycerophosphate/cardiolipin synthase-like enzyme